MTSTYRQGSLTTMSKRDDPWQAGRRAWDRLKDWRQDDGAAALDALCDVGKLRLLLDQAELVAVRAARRHGRSWAEIATQLGVTRQSAWERWRDLDDVAAAKPAEVVAPVQEIRRRSSVVVPNVVGKPTPEARRALYDLGLVASSADPDGEPLGMSGVITDQAPESGAKVPAGATVTLWVQRGGGYGGVREPRRPKPGPRSAREALQEPSDEAVG